MNDHFPKHENKPPGDWQIVGELHLGVGAPASRTVDAWLVERLLLLHLPASFVNRVIDSAREALERSAQVTAEQPFDHVHLLLLTPRSRPLAGQTWGFFRMEKIMPPASDHAIELYLYPESR